MADREALYTALRNADAAGDTAAAQRLASYIQTLPQDAPAAAPTSIADDVKQGAKNIAAGAVRGAGSIGATLMYPIDKVTDMVKGDREVGLSNTVAGTKPQSRNEERRQDMDMALSQLVGADPDSLAYKAGKLGGEIAGTAGAGGAMANTLRAVPGLAAATPNLLNAIRTGGMTAGTGGNVLANLGTRAAGGAISGGVSAGLTNPADVGSGALIGGALPGVTGAAGVVGNALGKIVRGPAQSADVAAAVQAARGAGYVLPPTQARPSLMNRALEGFAGKITTAQNASTKNQSVTNSLVADALGLPRDVKLTPDVLDGIRQNAAQAYRDVAALPVKPATSADSLMNIPASPEINPAQMVFDLRKARNDATAWFKSYNRTASPDALEKAQAAASSASTLEKGLEDYATSVGRPDLVPAMVESRALIAKTHDVEKALNETTGNVDARKLASMQAKGKPLSGGLKEAAQFAARFPRAAQTIEGMGSLPGTSPLDFAASGGMSAATGNPLMMAGVLARPGARALALSPVVQNRLIQSSAGGLPSPAVVNLLQGAYRSAPLIGADQ